MQETKTPSTGNLLGAKVYFDGSQWIAIPHTERPYRKRGNKIRAKPNESEAVAEFEQAFKKAKGKRRKRKESLVKEFAPMFQSEEQASEFVEEQFNRLSRNRWERYKRMIRRVYLQSWDYFVCRGTKRKPKDNQWETKRKPKGRFVISRQERTIPIKRQRKQRVIVHIQRNINLI